MLETLTGEKASCIARERDVACGVEQSLFNCEPPRVELLSIPKLPDRILFTT
jgi:hypothetical protein